jgi:hypothetical protein
MMDGTASRERDEPARHAHVRLRDVEQNQSMTLLRSGCTRACLRHKHCRHRHVIDVPSS